ncbi:ThuA domain-containing protein [Tamlana sp. I1]|uniref:ThuA domain-containing protein n=1 Tax=Tamlana sp. I1 TaxID=2762061 RepID=UPI00189077CA|nr:ThuA domain-containing protein [Tamlana sp. I1]
MKTATLRLLIPVFCFIVTLSSNAQEKASAELPSLKNKHVILVYGGWEGHQPKASAEKIQEWLLKEGAQVTLSDSLGVYTQTEIMKHADLIIQHWTMGEISNTQIKALENAVKNGVGLAGFHGGLGDAFRNNTEYQYMIGGQFVKHPGGKVDYKVTIADNINPITKGLKDFKVSHTEQYYMHMDPKVNVLATTTFSGAHDSWIKGVVMPVCWTTQYGKGKVFYLSIGHQPSDLDTYETRQLLIRGFRWACK